MHPLRQIAWLNLANHAAQEKNWEQARAYFTKTGLTQEQCALLGMTPAMTRSNASSNDFPREAWEMGFEGWARVEMDITADGKTANMRAITAYPPQIFSDAVISISKGMRYTPSYSPGSSVACSANRENFTFKIQ